MEIVNKILCEHKLPIPFEKFGECEEEDFKDVQWDELDFYTSSFFDYQDGPNAFSIYTITEDGQFYKNLIQIEVEEDKNKNLVPVERDMGIEKQDFTGEILFGATIFGDNDYDYEISFSSLFYKGELKELELESWDKKCNKKRRELLNKIQETIANPPKKENLILLGIRWALIEVTSFIKWTMYVALKIILKIESWIMK